MSRVFTDENFVTWEAYASTGNFGLPENPRIVFNCLSDPDRRARFVVHQGDEADADALVNETSDATLRQMLAASRELR